MERGRDLLIESSPSPLLTLGSDHVFRENMFVSFRDLFTILRHLDQENSDGKKSFELGKNNFKFSLWGNPFFQDFRLRVGRKVSALDKSVHFIGQGGCNVGGLGGPADNAPFFAKVVQVIPQGRFPDR